MRVSQVLTPCSKVCYKTAEAHLPPSYFSIHLRQIQSPWRWRLYATLQRQNKPLLHGAKMPKQPPIEEQPSWKPENLQGLEEAVTQWCRRFTPLCKPLHLKTG